MPQRSDIEVSIELENLAFQHGVENPGHLAGLIGNGWACTACDPDLFVDHKVIQAVQRHATKYYDKGGWDIVIEAYTDDELALLIAREFEGEGLPGAREAIRLVGKAVGVYDEVRKDIQATAF